MSERQTFVFIWLVASSVMELIWWLAGYKFDPGWIISVYLVVPACGWLMPDRESKEN